MRVMDKLFARNVSRVRFAAQPRFEKWVGFGSVTAYSYDAALLSMKERGGGENKKAKISEKRCPWVLARVFETSDIRYYGGVWGMLEYGS